jgi:predicted transcriptional regulator
MLQSVINVLFGCGHPRTTFPITPARSTSAPVAATASATYVVCLDCGKQFAYDWKSMRVGEQVRQPVTSTAVQAVVR